MGMSTQIIVAGLVLAAGAGATVAIFPSDEKPAAGPHRGLSRSPARREAILTAFQEESHELRGFNSLSPKSANVAAEMQQQVPTDNALLLVTRAERVEIPPVGPMDLPLLGDERSHPRTTPSTGRALVAPLQADIEHQQAESRPAGRRETESLSATQPTLSQLFPDPPATRPLEGSAEAGIDERTRFVPPAKPDVSAPATPPMSTPENNDHSRAYLDWQRATGEWHGVRPWLEDRGFSLNAQLTSDTSYDFSGGAKPRSGAYRQLLNINLTLDTDRLVGLKGGTAYVAFQNQVGRNGSDVVGDAQGISNIDADGRTEISEVWYQQTLLEDRVKVKIGKIDVNTDFAAPVYAAEFIHSAMGHSPTIPMPTYPDPSTGGSIFWNISDNWYIGGGLFDAAYARGVNTGENGPRTFLKSPRALFTIAEAGAKWSIGNASELAGRLAVGGWYLDVDLPVFDGTTRSGTSGYYLVTEQQIWRKNPDKKDDTAGLAIFGQYGWADAGVSEINQHIGAGIAWTAPFEGRDNDVAGLGVTYAAFGNDPAVSRDGETDVELFYKWQITPFLSFKPDVQYIHNPGGIRRRDDALVGTLRFTASF